MLVKMLWSKKQMSSLYLGRETKYVLRNKFERPKLNYGSVSWPLIKQCANMFQTLERLVVRGIYGPIKKNGIWRPSYNHELYKLNMNQIQWKRSK
jgi:hypothetical protein